MTTDYVKERIIPITNNGKEYYIYFTGTTKVVTVNGKKKEREVFQYLDRNFNRLLTRDDFSNLPKDLERLFPSRPSETNNFINVPFSESKGLLEAAKAEGFSAFVGDHQPEIYNPNEDTYEPFDGCTCRVGIWKRATRAEMEKYDKMLERQKKQQEAIKLLKKLSA